MAKTKESKKLDKKLTKPTTYHNYINGEWVKSSSGEWFENLNPADTTDIVGRFPKSNEDDVNKAVEAAKNVATRWRRTPAPKRAENFVQTRTNFGAQQRRIYSPNDS